MARWARERKGSNDLFTETSAITVAVIITAIVAIKPDQKAMIQLNVTQPLTKYYFTIMCLQPNMEHNLISSLHCNELLPLACSVSLLSSGGEYLQLACPFKVVAVNSSQEK